MAESSFRDFPNAFNISNIDIPTLAAYGRLVRDDCDVMEGMKGKTGGLSYHRMSSLSASNLFTKTDGKRDTRK